jgi:hypothetical protein
MLVGVVGGASYGFMSAKRDAKGCRDGPCGLAYLAVPIAGTGGFLLGAIVGISIHYDSWRPARLD